MARKKQFDPKEKAKRQKIMVAVGGVLLLGLLAFQVPRTMKMLHQQGVGNDTSSTAASTTPVSGTGAPLAPPNLDGGSGGSAAGGGGGSTGDGLSDPSTNLAAAPGQLVTFDRFRSKDPFFQQLGPRSSSESTSQQQSASTQPQQKPSSGGGTNGGTQPSNNPPPPPPPVPAPHLTSATISVNGVTETVVVGKTFPEADPVFVLVSASKNSVKIGIAGGSYQSGASTVTLKKGHALTLMNTADSTQYVLKLISTA